MWPFSTIAMLRRELDEVKSHAAQLNKLANENYIKLRDANEAILKLELRLAEARTREDQRISEIRSLSEALEQSRKNDSARDTKTGRFAKRVPGDA